MDGSEDTITVFTARSPDRILREGGSQAWVLNPARAKLCKWLVCTQNRHNPDHEFSDATEPHGAAFLLAKISGIARPNDGSEGDRWLITISEYARINVPNVWAHLRNPVHYSAIADLAKYGFCLDGVEFQTLPKLEQERRAEEDARVAPSGARGMTIEEAKKGLATTFGVKPEAIEITIRG